MKTGLMLGTVGLVLAAFAAPVSATHIAGGIADPIASLFTTPDTITTEMWWAGVTIDTCNINALLCQTVAVMGTSTIGGTTTNTNFFFGITICEQESLTGPGPHAGYGGRCSSAPIPAPADPVNIDAWSTFDVNVAAGATGCNPAWGATADFFARAANNANSVTVDSTESSAYRDAAVFWLTAGTWHLTYFVDASNNSNNLRCYGDDTHTGGFTTGQIAKVECNNSGSVGPIVLLDTFCVI